MKPTEKYDLYVRSTIVRGEKANKGLEATAAPTPHQMNRLAGFLPDGTPIIVAQRPGKGGMDFNKLLGGKVYAVAADGMSPVYEKDKDGKPTKTQKLEEGKPLYSSSGFYLLSSKEYPALDMFEAYTLLQDNGSRALLLTAENMAEQLQFTLTSDLDLELIQSSFEDSLSDMYNLVSRYDEITNKKRKRGIERATVEAEDADETYSGVAFKELAVSKKDGNPFIYYAWKAGDGPVVTGTLMRERDHLDAKNRPVITYLNPQEAIQEFVKSPEYQQLAKVLAAGKEVEFAYVTGHVMRTSVSFRRKAENVLAASPDKPVYGDGVYIHAALKGWVKGLVAVMHSQHPNFPQADYDAHHYVVALRQSEIGMNKTGDGKWTPPKGVHYNVADNILR